MADKEINNIDDAENRPALKPYSEMKFTQEMIKSLRVTGDDLFNSMDNEKLREIKDGIATAKESGLTKVVEQVTKDYNAAHPDQFPLEPPKYVVQNDEGENKYVINDMMYISEEARALPEGELNAVIAHELGHKEHLEDGKKEVLYYDSSLHEESTASELRKICTAENVPKEMIDEALPLVNNFGEVSIEDRISNKLAKIELSQEYPECNAQVNNLHNTLQEALDNMDSDNLSKVREREAGADKRSAETYSPELIIGALNSLNAGKFSPEDDHKYTHPSIFTRAKELGCEVHYDTKGDFEIECPNVPNHNADSKTAER